MVWPTSLAIREGLVNAWAARSQSLIVIVFVAWVVGGVGAANSLEISRLVSAEREWISAGAFAYVAEAGSASGGGVIDARACERLSSTNGVIASFAVVSVDSVVEPANAPGTQTTLVFASPGVMSFYGLQTGVGAFVIATDGATQRTGLADGEQTVFHTLALDGSSRTDDFLATVIVLRSTMIPELLEGSFVSPTASAREATSCFVLSDAAHFEAVGRYLSVALAYGESTPIVRPLLSRSSFNTDFSEAFERRVLRWSWVAGALALGAFWGILQWTRRTRLAVYATFGAPYRARMWIQVSEWLALALVGGSWGWGLGTVGALAAGCDASVTLTQVSATAVGTLSAASLLVVVLGLLPVGSLLDALKDRT